MTSNPGIALHHETLGPPDGPPLVLLHAFPLGRDLWRPVAGLLDGVRCILVDLPGSGGSPLPEGEPDLSVSIAGVVGVLDELGLDRAAIAGVSMGGYVTLGLMRDHPARVAGAGLVDTKVDADTPEARANRIRMAEAVLGEPGRRALAPLTGSLIGDASRSERPAVVAQLDRWLADASLAGVAWSQRAMAARPDTAKTLSAAAVPVAVVVGEEDGLTPPEAAERMHRLAGDSVLTVVPRSGHLSPLEAPEAVAAALQGLIARIPFPLPEGKP